MPLQKMPIFLIPRLGSRRSSVLLGLNLLVSSGSGSAPVPDVSYCILQSIQSVYYTLYSHKEKHISHNIAKIPR